MDTFLYLTQANKIRTKLLLHCQSEIAYYKYNKTRINSKLSSDLYSKYDSIEIVIINPLEQGNTNDIPIHFVERKKSNSSVGTPCPQDIGDFVNNLNRTLFSERKLKHNRVINLESMNYHTLSSKLMHTKRLSQMKKSCQFLRRLSSNFILKIPKTKSKKMTHQIVSKAHLVCFDFEENENDKLCGIATQRYTSKAKFDLNEPILNEPIIENNNFNDKNYTNKIYQKHYHHSAKKEKNTNKFRTNACLAQNIKEEENKKNGSNRNTMRINTNIYNGDIEKKYSPFTIEKKRIEINNNTNDDELRKIKCYISNGRSLPFNYKNTKKLF